ncbi:MAG TPA: DUF1549 domain-containing protein [Planctomycetota bacterium]
MAIRAWMGAALAALLALPAATAEPGGLPREKMLAAAREIDRLVEADLTAAGLQPNAALDDPSFIRRAYLDIAGRVPTAKELADVLAAPASERREALIDRLLESPAYASHLFNWLADLLRVKSRLQNNISGEPYIHFIKESLATNKPWDVFVRELLTASGPAHQRGHGATGYYLRDRGMPEDNMSNTITIFLGTRLECAQCHNHPFDKWTQLQYHEMVAFTGGIRYTDDSLQKTPEGQRLKEMGEAFRAAGKDRKENLEFRAYRKMLQPLEYGISGSGNGLYRLPKDYQYEDAKANQPVKAKAMFGVEVPLAVEIPADRKAPPADKKNPKKAPAIKASDVNSREAYAKWLTAPENPRFTTVIANRLWKRFFGAGVIEPVDNIRETTKPVNPALMKHLETTMIAAGYDLKQFIRVLMNSRSYQREACRKEPSDEQPFRFPGPLLRRMSAEQLWDSMLTLVVPDVDSTLRKPGAAAEAVYADYDRLVNVNPDQLKAQVEMEVLREKDPAKYRELKKKQGDEARALAKNDEKLKGLMEAAKAAKKKGDEEAVAKLRAEIQAMEKGPLLMPDMQAMYGKKTGPANGLARASDLPQPANPGSFLREFGQSDREQIEAAHADSSVPQALALLNGFVDKTILPNAKSAIRQAADAAKAPSDKVVSIFRSVLSRDPSPKEREIWAPDLEKRGEAALRDLIWTLVNTHEFMFVR